MYEIVPCVIVASRMLSLAIALPNLMHGVPVGGGGGGGGGGGVGSGDGEGGGLGQLGHPSPG